MSYQGSSPKFITDLDVIHYYIDNFFFRNCIGRAELKSCDQKSFLDKTICIVKRQNLFTTFLSQYISFSHANQNRKIIKFLY